MREMEVGNVSNVTIKQQSTDGNDHHNDCLHIQDVWHLGLILIEKLPVAVATIVVHLVILRIHRINHFK